MKFTVARLVSLPLFVAWEIILIMQMTRGLPSVTAIAAVLALVSAVVYYRIVVPNNNGGRNVRRTRS